MKEMNTEQPPIPEGWIALRPDKAHEWVREWMATHYADLKTTDPDGYYARLGMIYEAIIDISTLQSLR